ncbi:phosphotransferase family protein [Sphingorhabdus sp.]|uniref:phosphotransferase family protein n=1 Tax=Sphingorhabdus sp. TaxID=1902408 RepID=UPI0038FD19D7
MGEYEIINEGQRQRPNDAIIAQIRDRYPTEPEIDRVLTTKMKRRQAGKCFEAATLSQLIEGASNLISDRLGRPVKISNAKWLSGGASKIQMKFELEWTGPDGEDRTDVLVLRMEPAASVTESSRTREFEVINAVNGIIPAPRPFWVDPDGSFLPYPAMVYAFASGSAKPSYDAAKVSGLGQNYGPKLRAQLAPQFVGLLAKLHTIDVTSIDGMEHFERPIVGSNQSIIRQVNSMRRIWEEDRIEEEPIMEIIYRWLIANAPPLDHVSIVHGDYRSGNFLFDEEQGKITAWLDWEGASLGDRHQDLTYAIMPSFAHLAEDEATLLGSGMMAENDLYAAYEKASGLTVDPVRIAYFNIYNRYLIAILTLAASARASRSRGTHQDVLVNYVVGLGYPALADLRDYYLGVVT